MNENGPGGSTMEFKHGSSKTIFYLRPRVGGSQKNGDVIKYGDQVAISANNWPANKYQGKVHGCGWYGCRTAYVSDDRTMKFTHGKNDPKLFYIRPKIGSEQKNGDNFKFNDHFVLAYTGENNNTSNCGWYGCRVGQMVDNNGAHYLQFNHGGSSPASFIIRPQPNTLKCSDIYKCKKPCDGKWTLVNNPAGTIMTQLSCSNTHVYGLDSNKRAWRKNIDGSGEWSKFGNPWSWPFNQINASSSSGKILAVGTGRRIWETDKNGTAQWNYSSSAGGASGISTISGDSQNEDFYFTNTNDQIYRNTPITSGGYWTDIKNENYANGLVQLQESNENWKFLGKTNNIEKCKIKAVHDKENEYSSIVYTGSGNNPNACFGGIKGGKTNPTHIKGVITSLAPNGNTRLGGEAGNKILKEMKKIHNQIKNISKQAEKDNIGLQKSNNLLNINKSAQEQELTQLLKKLSNDRKKINKILNEPDELGAAEESGFRQTSNYYMYLLWILLVLVSFVLSYHIISTDNESISTLAYVFVAIWILILGRYYYEKTKSYGVTILNYISTIFVNPV